MDMRETSNKADTRIRIALHDDTTYYHAPPQQQSYRRMCAAPALQQLLLQYTPGPQS